MASGSRFGEIVMVFAISLATLAVLNMSFGEVMDSLHYQFVNLTASLLASGHISGAWAAVLTNITGLWASVFWNSFVIVIIALIIWIAKSVLFEDSYSRRAY